MEKSQLDALKETVEGLYSSGVMNEITKQEFDVLFASKNRPYKPLEIEELSPEEIKGLRCRNALNEADFALYLHTTIPTIKSWESGEKKPKGPELALLNIVKQKGLRGLSANGY
jgi:putative transcriptional regulator